MYYDAEFSTQLDRRVDQRASPVFMRDCTGCVYRVIPGFSHPCLVVGTPMDPVEFLIFQERNQNELIRSNSAKESNQIYSNRRISCSTAAMDVSLLVPRAVPFKLSMLEYSVVF